MPAKLSLKKYSPVGSFNSSQISSLIPLCILPFHPNLGNSLLHTHLDVASTPPSPNMASLLDLPTELRLQLYEDLPIGEFKISIDRNLSQLSCDRKYTTKQPSILLVNKQIHEEDSNVLYKSTIFTLVLNNHCPFYIYESAKRQYQAQLDSITSQIHTSQLYGYAFRLSAV